MASNDVRIKSLNRSGLLVHHFHPTDGYYLSSEKIDVPAGFGLPAYCTPDDYNPPVGKIGVYQKLKRNAWVYVDDSRKLNLWDALGNKWVAPSPIAKPPEGLIKTRPPYCGKGYFLEYTDKGWVKHRDYLGKTIYFKDGGASVFVGEERTIIEDEFFTDIAPTVTMQVEVARNHSMDLQFIDGEWTKVFIFESMQTFDKETGEVVNLTGLGKTLPDNVTAKVPPNNYSSWSEVEDDWVEDSVKKGMWLISRYLDVTNEATYVPDYRLPSGEVITQEERADLFDYRDSLHALIPWKPKAENVPPLPTWFTGENDVKDPLVTKKSSS